MTNAFGSANPQQSQAKVKTISEIVSALIKAHQTNKPIDVDRLKSRLAGQNGLSDLPKMVDIIAAIPEQYRKALLPALKTKPVRTASGVRNISKGKNTTKSMFLKIDSCRRCNVQATPLPTHRNDRKYLRVRIKTINCSELIYTQNSYCPGGPDSDFEYSTQAYTGIVIF